MGQPRMANIPITDVKVGKRFRSQVGDVSELQKSIAEVGLIHPIAVAEDKTLIAGRRRLAAFVELGRSEIPAVVLPLAEGAVGFIGNDERPDCKAAVEIQTFFA